MCSCLTAKSTPCNSMITAYLRGCRVQRRSGYGYAWSQSSCRCATSSNAPAQHQVTSYFPSAAIVSIVAGPADQQAEVGIVGRFEMTGAWSFLGQETSPSTGFVQMPGEALRVAWSDLIRTMDEYPAIHAACLYGTGMLMRQITDTAWSNARATLAERTARWIILCYERM